MTCPICGHPMPALTNRGKPREVCSARCSAAMSSAVRNAGRTAADRAEDVSDLLDAGESPAQIAKRLGIGPGAVAKAMERAGRPDLARPFEAVRWSARRHPCVDCGDPVGADALRCHPCATIAQKSDPGYIERHCAGVRRSLARRGLTRQPIEENATKETAV